MSEVTPSSSATSGGANDDKEKDVTLDLLQLHVDVWKYYDGEIWKVFSVLGAALGLAFAVLRFVGSADGGPGVDPGRNYLITGVFLTGLSSTLAIYGYVLLKHRWFQDTVSNATEHLLKESNLKERFPEQLKERFLWVAFGRDKPRTKEPLLRKAVGAAIGGSAFYVVFCGFGIILGLLFLTGVYLIERASPVAGLCFYALLVTAVALLRHERRVKR